MPDTDTPLTQLLQLAQRGDRDALDRLYSALYPELRRIAHARLYGHGDPQQLGTTALVHESFLRLVEQAQLQIPDRRHFFAYAAKTMRSIIIDLARQHLTERRGGGVNPLPLDTGIAESAAGSSDEDLIRVNDALLALEAVDPTLARVVEMRYFAGYSEVEVAELLGSSERTVRRQWDKARTFLLANLRD